MAARNILYSVARSETGDLIRAAAAKKGERFFCGYCKDPLVLRNSGKTGPRTKRPHFAHKVLTPNCTPESALHFEFKNLLASEIQRCLDERIELPIHWKCRYCYGEHSGDLVKKASRVELEHSLGVCRPDIALFDRNGKVHAVVEVVVTHPPEDAVRDYYRKNRISLVELNLKSDEILSDVKAKLLSSDQVHLCLSWTRCDACGHFQQPVEMRIIDVDCYHCKAKMKLPFIVGDDSCSSLNTPDGFSKKEIDLASEHGAIIEWKYSKSERANYWAATCGWCRRFLGRRFLFTDYIAPSQFDRSPPIIVRLGNYCSYCEEIKHNRSDH